MPKGLWLVLGLLLAFAGGYAVRSQQVRQQTELARLRADSVLQAVTVQHARARDSFAAIGRQSRARADSAERAAADKRRVAALFKLRADSLTAALAIQVTAADSLPLVILQRDGIQAAYDTLAVGYDSLLAATRSLRTTVAVGDSLLDLSHRDAAAREAALHSLNASLRLELDRARNRGKLLGLIRLPEEVKLLAAAYAGCRAAGGCKL